jgi:hypothetical protein
MLNTIAYESLTTTEAIFAYRLGGRSVEEFDTNRRLLQRQSSHADRIYPLVRQEQVVISDRQSLPTADEDGYPYHRYGGSPSGRESMREGFRR